MKKIANISAIHRLSTHEIFADEFKLVTDQAFPDKVCDIISPVFDVNSVDSNMTIFEDLEGLADRFGWRIGDVKSKQYSGHEWRSYEFKYNRRGAK